MPRARLRDLIDQYSEQLETGIECDAARTYRLQVQAHYPNISFDRIMAIIMVHYIETTP